MSGRSAAVIIRTSYASLPRLERFVDAYPGLSGATAARAKLVACELFDNLVAHGSGVLPPFAAVTLSSVHGLTLTFRFRSSNLPTLRRALGEARSGSGGKPRFDAAAGLYRGFGLKMCVELASAIEVRRGLFWHRVSVVFS
jgi:hypothetical protein